MNKITITNVVISKGYKDNPALRFNENKTSAQFKIGERVYDKKAPDNHRYINYAVKAFSPLSERIEKMQLKEGSRINISGRMDEENWEDNGQKYSRFVIIADDIEYASSDTNKSNGSGTNNNGVAAVSPAPNGNGQSAVPQNSPPAPNPQNPPGDNNGNPAGFTGYEEYNPGGDNIFY